MYTGDSVKPATLLSELLYSYYIELVGDHVWALKKWPLYEGGLLYEGQKSIVRLLFGLNQMVFIRKDTGGL